MVEGGSRFAEEPIMRSTPITILEADRVMELRIQSYIELLRQRPELSQYMTPNLAQNAARIKTFRSNIGH